MTAVLEPARVVPVRSPVRRWTPLALIFLSVGLSTAMAFPFLTLFLTEDVHASPLRVTIFLVAAPLSTVLVATLIGRLSDRRPIRRRLILGAALAGCAGALLTAVVRDYWVLLALTVTVTAAAGSILPQLFAYARTALHGSDRAAMTMSTLRTLFSLSWVAGPFLATVLLGLGRFALVYGFSATMYLLAAVLVWRLLPDSPAEDAGRRTAYSPAAPPEPDAPRRVIALTVAALVLLQCAGNLGVQALSLFLTTELGVGIGKVGLILGFCAGLEIPLMLGFGFLSTRVPLRRMILAGPLFSVAYALAVASAAHAWQVAAAQILNASAIAVLQGLGVSYIQELLPRRPGRASTLFTNAFPAGAVLAGPLLGVAQHVGYRAAYLTGAALAAVALALLITARPSARRARLARPPRAAPATRC